MNTIKQLRKCKGWTQEELGRKLNVQKAAISKYENGTVIPSNNVLIKLSKIFGVSTDYLLDNAPNDTDNKKAVYHLTDEQVQLLESYDTLSNNGQNLLKGVMESLRMTHSKTGYSITQKNTSGNTIVNIGGTSSATVI